MEPGTLLILLLVLACPLMMVFMHRGGHGHHLDAANERQAHQSDASVTHEVLASLEELRRRRDELDAEIALREQAELETPVGT